MENILTIRELNKNYKEFSLKDINLEIPKGSIMGLVGENGSGKTTTIKAILNIIKRDSGTIKVFGLDNIGDEMAIKEEIGVVLDDCYFNENLTNKDVNIIMKNIYKNWDEDKFSYYMEIFKLSKDKKIKEYSKGMKMKLSIGVALSHDPKFLILDEPTAGLDPIARNQILDELLNFIQNEEKSVLFSTHITSDLDKIADYITLIHEGEIVLSRDRETLLTDYGVLRCKREDYQRIAKEDIVAFKEKAFGYEVLIGDRYRAMDKYQGLAIDPVNIEDIMLFLIRR